MINADAVVVGAGPNGLVAANALADAGWDVVLVEANDEVGGAVRSAEVTAPGYVTDLFSAFYPLAAAPRSSATSTSSSTACVWRRAPHVLAHALDDGSAAVLSLRRRPHRGRASRPWPPATARPGWSMVGQWERIRDPLLDALFTPFPPVTSAVRMLRRLGAAGTLDLARLAVMPVRRLGRGDASAARAPGCCSPATRMHSDVPPDAAGSGVFGWLLCMLGQDVGFPVPRGRRGRARRRAAASGREPRRCSVLHRRPGDVGRRPPAAGPSASGWPTAAWSEPGAACWPTSPPRRSTASWSADHHLPGPAAPGPRQVPVGQRHHQGQLGPRPARCRGRRRRRPRRRHRAPRRRPRRVRRLRRRPVGGPGPAAAVRCCSAR